MSDLEERRFGRTTVLFGARGGRYPEGNTLLVEGSDARILIDPSLGLLPRRDALPAAERVLFSHCHEDHFAGAFLYPGIPWHVHQADLHGFRSLDHMMEIYGYPEPIQSAFRKTVEERFHYRPRPDALPFRDGDRFELGGGATVRVEHTPGHTRGHCALWVEPDGLVYLGDIDLSSFGPYYGDAWSDLEAFERTLRRVREMDARWYATFHHIGVLEGRAAFLERLDRFAAVIGDRERRLLGYLAEPRTLDEIAEHRFVYRPGDPVAFASAVERRSMAQHLERLRAQGRVREVDPGRFAA
jgi:glyoxylase-like metal-dependent hydrolase (beta-lactamase superfamily II)